MATYTKKLKTLVVHTMMGDLASSFSIADTATDPMASNALSDFMQYRDIVFSATQGGRVGTVSIPYHAIQYIEVTETEATVERQDPYCE